MQYNNKNIIALAAGVGLTVGVALGWTKPWTWRPKLRMTMAENGMQYAQRKKGTGAKPSPGEIIVIDVTVTADNGMVLYQDNNSALPYSLVADKNGKSEMAKNMPHFAAALAMLQEGDEYVISSTAKKLLGDMGRLMAKRYKLEADAAVTMEVSLKQVLSRKAFEAWAAQRKAEEELERQKKSAVQLKQDIAILQEHLKAKGIVAESLPSGLFYRIDKKGNGPLPKKGDKVSIRYIGAKLSGEIFDTNYPEKSKQLGRNNTEPLHFTVGGSGLIAGMEQGACLVAKGGKVSLWIPSTLAYGEDSFGPIDANEILHFEAEVLDIQEAAKSKTTTKSASAKK